MIAKSLVRNLLPRSTIELGKQLYFAAPLNAAKAALLNTTSGPDWLDLDQLEALKLEYPVTHFYQPDLKLSPAYDRTKDLVKLFGGSPKNLLEIGGGRGLEAWVMAQAGHTVVCLDLIDELDPGARAAGVEIIVGDAERMDLADNSIDGLWSLNCFEHLHNPRKVLDESWRVVKAGGLIHIAFAPIYNSPLGLHAFQEIGVPYCQHLWKPDDLKKVVSSKELCNLNYWTIFNYRELWSGFLGKLRIIDHVEEQDFNGLELITRFPSCFSKSSRAIEYFTKSKITITFEVVK